MAGDAKNVPLADLGLPPALLKKLEPIVDTKGLRALRPEVLAKEWRLTERQYDRISLALQSRGYSALVPWVEPEKGPARKSSLKGKCRKMVPDPVGPNEATNGTTACGRPLLATKRSCLWHWLEAQPIDEQVKAADQRRAYSEAVEGFTFRARVPEAEWPEGHRWCAECQAMIPLFYCRGSRCRAHASRAAHASMVKRVYDLTREEYDALLAWQRGRCYICQQVPRGKRLAVDHDHRTGEVRGLLCANDEWGCNSTLRRLLNSQSMAQRALDYVSQTPLQRMLEGQSPVVIDERARAAAIQRGGDPAAGGPTRSNPAMFPDPDGRRRDAHGVPDPFAGF